MIIDQLRSEKDGQVLKIFLSEPLTISYSQPEEKDCRSLRQSFFARSNEPCADGKIMKKPCILTIFFDESG